MLRLLAIAAALFTSAALAAADNTSDPAQPGRDAASATIAAIAGDPVMKRPMASLLLPLCLSIAASDSDFADDIGQRILRNADEAGVPIKQKGCTANAMLAFVDNPRSQLQASHEDRSPLFTLMREKDIEAALAARDPAFVFQSVAPSNLNSRLADVCTTAGRFMRGPDFMLSAAMIIDEAAAASLPRQQLADYITLRLLAPPGEFDPARTQAADTVLSLFADPAAAPAGMTRFDSAYLATLYRLPRSAYASEVLAETMAEVTGTRRNTAMPDRGRSELRCTWIPRSRF